MSDIYLQITETPTVVTLSAPVVSGALSSTVTVANTVTVALDSNSLSALENVTVTVGAAVTISNFPATQAVSLASVPTHGVTLTSTTVTVSSLPAITGTVTANVYSLPENFSASIANGLSTYTNNEGNFPVAVNYAEPITGTVEVSNISSLFDAQDNTVIRTSVFGYDYVNETAVAIAANGSSLSVQGSVTASISGTVPVTGTFWQSTQPVSGTFWQATQPVSLAATTVTISANPAGSLTTRFGSVTTANTTQITTAVTNTARKYLFIQNISIGSVTVGVGFSPTTTQGIQLSPGSGMTFDSFCPTGAVWWLGATTGATWTILEG
jgi:hypothetical protein